MRRGGSGEGGNDRKGWMLVDADNPLCLGSHLEIHVQKEEESISCVSPIVFAEIGRSDEVYLADLGH